MQPIIVREMQAFLRPSANEEMLDQPLYHFQSYGTAGATLFTFFQTTTGSATNLLSDTNMDVAGQLSAGKRFGLFGISVVFLPGIAPLVGQTTTANIVPTSAIADAKGVLEGIGFVELKIMDKRYGDWAPLAYLPAGMGTFGSIGGLINNQQTAANNSMEASWASNGIPLPAASRRLRVPLPLPPQVNFSVTLNFNTAITVSTASRIGVILDGVLIRAKQ